MWQVVTEGRWAVQVCKEAEIGVITKDTEERSATEFLAQVNEGQI